jgi:hypothetical protein
MRSLIRLALRRHLLAASPQPDANANDNSPEALAAIKQQARWLTRDMLAA